MLGILDHHSRNEGRFDGQYDLTADLPLLASAVNGFEGPALPDLSSTSPNLSSESPSSTPPSDSGNHSIQWGRWEYLN
jgi:hypothetical protein